MKKILLVYYSRTGYTASIARQMASLENWDIEEVRDRHSRTGAWGFMRSLFDVLTGRYPAIQNGFSDPSEYNVVIIGASVWMKQLCSPIRTYIKEHRHEFRQLAFFCTYGGKGAETAAKQCENLAAKPLIGSLAITDNEIEQETYWPKFDEFVRQIHQANA